MTENQFTQMMNMITKSVTSTQRLEKEVAELNAGQARLESEVAEIKFGQERMGFDISELKDGQNRLEREMRTNNRAVNDLAGENIRIKGRVEVLEE